jgi:hypothetical protein
LGTNGNTENKYWVSRISQNIKDVLGTIDVIK